MTLFYATSQEEKHRIALLLQRYANDQVVIPQNEAEIVKLARKHRPQTVLMFMPGQSGATVEIQAYLREFLHHARIRILPSKPGTTKLLAGWEKVVANAFRTPGAANKKAAQS